MRGTRRIEVVDISHSIFYVTKNLSIISEIFKVAGAPGGHATVMDPRDHERYSAIDRRIYR